MSLAPYDSARRTTDDLDDRVDSDETLSLHGDTDDLRDRSGDFSLSDPLSPISTDLMFDTT